MLGGMLAGHDQNGGELTIKPNGTKCKLFYGMSSLTAMKKHAGGKAEYRYVFLVICYWATLIYNFCRAAEGKAVEVPYRGDVNDTILDILGGLRSACTYTGAHTLKELPKRATFIRCTQQVNSVYSNITSGE